MLAMTEDPKSVGAEDINASNDSKSLQSVSAENLPVLLGRHASAPCPKPEPPGAALQIHLVELQKFLQGWLQQQASLVDTLLLIERASHNFDHEMTPHSEEQLERNQSKLSAPGLADSPRTSRHNLCGDGTETCKSHSCRSTVTASSMLAPDSQMLVALGLRNASDPENENTSRWASLSCTSSVAHPGKKKDPPLITRLVDSQLFDAMCSCVIMANAVFMAWSCDYQMKNIGRAQDIPLDAIEAGFCCFYTLEVLIRVVGHGMKFLCGPDCAWNMFDCLLVVQAILEQVAHFAGGAASGVKGSVNLSFLRILRILKMLKLLRVIRLLRIFKGLRLVLHSMMGSMKALTWSCVLIVAITYVFGLCFLQAGLGYIEDGGVHPETVDAIFKFWGSVLTSMHSLYMASTGGMDWQFPARPLSEVNPGFYCLFLVYMTFFIFIVANTLTSLVMETVMQNSEKDHARIIQMELKRKEAYISQIKDFFVQMDTDDSGTVDYKEFASSLHDAQMLAFASSLGLDLVDLDAFFHVLSAGGERAVDVETFVVGCIKMRGTAKSLDLMDLIYSHRRLMEAQDGFESYCRAALHDMRAILVQRSDSPQCVTSNQRSDSPQRATRGSRIVFDLPNVPSLRT